MSNIGKLCVCFDDAFESVASVAFPIMQPLSVVATVYVNSGKTIEHIAPADIGPWNETYMTVEQLTTLQQAGWLIANHTENHVHVPAQTNSVILAEYINCKNWLQQNGFSDGAEWVAFPYNEYNQNVLDILKSAGCKYTGGKANQTVVSAGSRYEDPRQSMSGWNVAGFKTKIDKVIEKKAYLHMYFHHIRDPVIWGNTSTSEADFTEMMEYLQTKIAAGTIEVMTIKDYINTYADSSRLKIKTT